MNITGAIFDMDGTLADSLGFWDYLWEYIGKKYNGGSFLPDPQTEQALRTTLMKDGMYLLHEKYGFGESGEAFYRDTAALLVKFYAEEIKLKPGVLEFLEHLKMRGVKMCVASATELPLLESLCARYKLERYFTKIFSCQQIGKGKESPEVFNVAHRYLGTAKESTWIFEDSVLALDTSVKAGYNTVGIYDKYGFEPERVKALSVKYIGEGETLEKLIPEI